MAAVAVPLETVVDREIIAWMPIAFRSSGSSVCSRDWLIRENNPPRVHPGGLSLHPVCIRGPDRATRGACDDVGKMSKACT